MPRQIEIAKALGVSKGRVSQLKKEGLPLDDVGKAKAWHAQNYGQLANKGPRVPEQTTLPAPAPEPPSPDDIRRDDPVGVLARARQAEMVAYSVIAESVRNKNVRDTRNATANWRTVMHARMEAEAEVARRAECLEYIIKRNNQLRGLLEALPAAIAARCNPSDPTTASAAIEDGVEQIISTMRST
ncbi:hypothetical protein EBZ39_13695 [bacterium]|nr:hypothetical protein [bacterium]